MTTISTVEAADRSSETGEVASTAFISFSRRGYGRLGAILVALAVLLGIATFTILTGLTPISPTRNLVTGLLLLNGIIIAAMATLISWQIIRLWKARRKKAAGAILHSRIVGLFSLFATVPAIIVALFASITLDRGLDTWFSERTQSIVKTSITVAEAYINEQKDLVEADLTGIGNSILQTRVLLEKNRPVFLRQMATLVALRNLAAAYVINRDTHKIEASVTAHSKIKFRPPGPAMFQQAEKGELVILWNRDSNVIRGLYKLKGFENRYLYIYRLINPIVSAQLTRARDEKKAYDIMLGQRTGLQITFAMMYIAVAFVFLLAAAWFGFWFADRLVEPIVALVNGARRVTRGKLDTKVPVRKGSGDLATLSSTFNQMTDQLQSQRNELIETNIQLDQRRQFTEAVLSGVSAGVIGISAQGTVTLVNRSALKLLARKRSQLMGKPFAKVLPEMVPVFEQAESKLSGRAEGQVQLKIGDDDKNFVVQVTTEKTGHDDHGVVVTFDDISDLVAAQRNSAWADIARRIAHEIKNPLTPIQLAAERLKRKYTKEIKSNPEVFEKCTETIIRQVGDIRGMVDEFSSFARMPSAVLEPVDLTQVTKDGIVLQKASFEDVRIETDIPGKPLVVSADRRLVTQAITNLVKNAKESVDSRLVKNPEPPGRIRISLKTTETEAIISVCDNGTGLPKNNRQRLTEPYMTTREKGTGLGLAIVKRIMQDHNGTISLDDAPADFDGGMGAMISLFFPLGKIQASDKPVDGKDKEKVNVR